MATAKFKSRLHEMVCTTPTDYWNDSGDVDELTYAIDHGAVGATSNPPISVQVIMKDLEHWRRQAVQLYVENPTWGEREIGWRLFEGIGCRGAEALYPVFEREGRLKGRLSIQTDPRHFRNPEAMVEQAVYFDSLAPNLQVKIPATKAGMKAIEEATARGINVNATVSFTVAQALLVGEAVERGLERRAAQSQDISKMSPVCTIMVGRLDDWMQVLTRRDGIIANPACVHWAGVACMKKAYRLYQERGFRTRLLAAAYRHHLHWSEFVGGDMILSMPYEWQLRFNASSIAVKPRIEDPVDAAILDELYERFPDFRRGYDEDGLSEDEIDAYGPTVRTLRGFTSALAEFMATVRDLILPNPDQR